MKILGLVCLLLALSIAFSGCLGGDLAENEGTQDPGGETSEWTTKTWEAAFGGTVPAGVPGHMDETSDGCEELTGGQEDSTYTWATFDVNHTPSQAELVLEWDPQDVGGLWVFPDLELRLVDPDGEYIDDCQGVTGGSPETIAMPLEKPGTYRAQIINYAGVMVDYELQVSLTYRVLVETVEPAVVDDADGDDGDDDA